MSFMVLRDGDLAFDGAGLRWRMDTLPAAQAYVAFHVGWTIGRLPPDDRRMKLPYPPFPDAWPFVTHADGSITIDVYGWRYTILEKSDANRGATD